MTRKAMADFWLKEYQTALKDVGKKKVNDAVKQIKEDNKHTNAERKKDTAPNP